MRQTILVLTLLCIPPAALSALAQAPQGGISREQFVARAAQRAGQRFDAMDVNRTGYVTRDQVRAFRQGHAGRRP